MSHPSNYDAQQYDDAFWPKRLGNWQKPREPAAPFPAGPTTDSEQTLFVVTNERGHLAKSFRKNDSSSFGRYNGATGQYEYYNLNGTLPSQRLESAAKNRSRSKTPERAGSSRTMSQRGSATGSRGEAATEEAEVGGEREVDLE